MLHLQEKKGKLAGSWHRRENNVPRRKNKHLSNHKVIRRAAALVKIVKKKTLRGLRFSCCWVLIFYKLVDPKWNTSKLLAEESVSAFETFSRPRQEIRSLDLNCRAVCKTAVSDWAQSAQSSGLRHNFFSHSWQISRRSTLPGKGVLVFKVELL